MKPGRNLQFPPVFDLVLAADEREALVIIFGWAEERTRITISWYLWRKTSRARWSKIWRALSIGLGVVGGLTPLVHAAYNGSLSPEWGFVFLGAAGACILADRLFGFSSSWMRFMTTQAALQKALSRSQSRYLAWCHSLPSAGDIPSKCVEELFAIVEDLVSSSAEIVESETSIWMDDLKLQIKQVDTRFSSGTLENGRDSSSG